MNAILREDFEYIASAGLDWDRLDHRTVFITGGTGFLGSLLIRFLHYLNETRRRGIRIVALVRDPGKARAILGDADVVLVQGDMCALPPLPMEIDYIFHCAAVTNSKLMIEQPVEVTEGMVLGTYEIMKLARLKKVSSMVYLSSMEVYGQIGAEDRETVESDQGYVDLYNARSSYQMGKRMAEHICFNYWTEYGVPVKAARLAQTFGAGVLDTERRVFAQFARSVMEGENIVLHTDGTSMGNYCYSADAVLGLFYLLLKGEDGQAYNIVNEQASMTIRDMAMLVAERVSGGAISVTFDIPETNVYGYAPKSRMRLSAGKLRSLGWKPKYNLEQMYSRMIAYLTDAGAAEREAPVEQTAVL